jgi:hypothetical protein
VEIVRPPLSGPPWADRKQQRSGKNDRNITSTVCVENYHKVLQKLAIRIPKLSLITKDNARYPYIEYPYSEFLLY